MDDLTDEEKGVIEKVLTSDVVKLAIGAEEWDLTEDEEMILWNVIDKLLGYDAKQP